MLIVSPGPRSLSSENGVTLDIQHHQNEQGCKINKNSPTTEHCDHCYLYQRRGLGIRSTNVNETLCCCIDVDAIVF